MGTVMLFLYQKGVMKYKVLGLISNVMVVNSGSNCGYFISSAHFVLVRIAHRFKTENRALGIMSDCIGYTPIKKINLKFKRAK